jgi:hypothetical protein
MQDLKQSQNEIRDQQMTIKALEENLAQTQVETKKAQDDRAEEHKLRLETDKEMKEVRLEN